MADESPKIQIDTDWKKQAQEEKRRLAEQEKAKAQAAAPAPAAKPAASAAPAGRASREPAAPSFASLVQSISTQVLYYLGDLTPRGAEPQMNLDMAKYQIDILGILEEKSKGNLSSDEQRLLDASLYEIRSRFVNVAAAVVNG